MNISWFYMTGKFTLRFELWSSTKMQRRQNELSKTRIFGLQKLKILNLFNLSGQRSINGRKWPRLPLIAAPWRVTMFNSRHRMKVVWLCHESGNELDVAGGSQPKISFCKLSRTLVILFRLKRTSFTDAIELIRPWSFVNIHKNKHNFEFTAVFWAVHHPTASSSS